MTVEQERAIRQTFRDAGLPEYAVGELAACVPFLVALLGHNRNIDDPFPQQSFFLRVGDSNYRLLFEEI